MALGDRIARLFTAGGTPDSALSSRDLGRGGSPNSTVQEVTHEVTGIQNFGPVTTTAGTPKRLIAGATPIVFVVIEALSSNSGTVVIGGSGVVATPGTQTTPTQVGASLNPGERLSLTYDDLRNIFFDVTNSGDGVTGFVLQ
jgi:hypothetical protein